MPEPRISTVKRKAYNPPDYHRIYIEVPEHIARFYQVESGGQVRIGRRGRLGNLVLGKLKPMSYGLKPERKEPGKYYVTLLVVERYTRRRKYLSPELRTEVVSLLRNYYDEFFQREVFKGISVYGLNQTESVEFFREKYQIDEDVFSFESMYKAYYRYKKNPTIL